MNFNTSQFSQVVEKALAQCGDKKRWQKAVERAADGLRNGSIVVSETVAGALVTTDGGSYRVNGSICECPAYRNGNQPCKHRAARRLIALYNAALMEAICSTCGETAKECPDCMEVKPKHSVETRTIEYDWRGNRHVVVRYDGWQI